MAGPVAFGQTGRDWLKVQPDKKYALGHVDVRFELPYDFPISGKPEHAARDYELLRLASHLEVQKAIEQFERLGDGHGGKWRFYDRIDPQFKRSQLPARAQLDTFNALKKNEVGRAIPVGAKPVVVWVARLYFIMPKTVINLDEQAEYDQFTKTEGSGFVPEMPADYYADQSQSPAEEPVDAS